MKKRILRRSAAVLAVSLLLPALALAAGEVGEAAAPFSLTSTEGDMYTLGQHLGQEVAHLFFVGHN